MARFAGKVCLVTGAARGIGAAIATAFAEEGAIVILTDRLADQVAETAASIGQIGGAQDVAEEAGWVAPITEIASDHGRLDVVVANAGYGWQAPVTAFLASDDASFVTGAELHVDGGFTTR